ncbi:MAG: UDP-N-acetylmuramate dehydrogenase [Clostridia bacterium]|nr:UDP-N-acetylmuramate dehydrogenase [Clostridia bacterium]
MITSEVIDKLKEFLNDEEIRVDELLSKHTTYKIGGKADIFVMPSSNEKVRDCIKLAKENNIDFYILGRGSNVLASDDGFRGIVINLADKFSNIDINDTCLTAQAGASIISASVRAQKAGLTGLEFVCGVPGTVGGAVAMNAGCYGSEMSNVLVKCKVVNDKNEIIELSKDDLDMSYRHTNIEEKNYVLLEATMQLEKGDAEQIKEKMNELNERRKKVQPLEYPNAGSVFKRPNIENCYPGQLIEEAGFKGFKIGGAEVSTMHANFIVNAGDAKAKEVWEIISEIKAKVKEMSNIDLELEQKILGKID